MSRAVPSARSCLLVLLFGSVAWAAQAEQRQELFADLRFQRGFLLSYPDSSKGRSVEAVLHLGDANNVPVWRLCQWATKYSLATVPCSQPTADDRSYENEGKKVLVGRRSSPNRDLVLEVRGSAEYGDRHRRSGESWPHLLIEQDAAVLRPLDELDEIRLALDLRLLDCTNRMPADQYDPGLHAAQFQMFFIIKNISPDSSDRNDYFWFGVPFFDSRHDIPPAYMAKDAGKDDATGKFIYTVDGKRVGVVPLGVDQWLTLDADLLPFIRSGLQEAVKRGYLKEADPHHYAVANVNLGWEMPGTFDAAIQIRDFGVSVIAGGSREHPCAGKQHCSRHCPYPNLSSTNCGPVGSGFSSRMAGVPMVSHPGYHSSPNRCGKNKQITYFAHTSARAGGKQGPGPSLSPSHPANVQVGAPVYAAACRTCHRRRIGTAGPLSVHLHSG